MPVEYTTEVGAWAYSTRAAFQRIGDDTGDLEFAWALHDCNQHAATLMSSLRRRVWSALDQHVPTELIAGIADITMDALLLHHGGRISWRAAPTRIDWIYYLHSSPKMYSGGAVEMIDGQLIEPQNNRLVLLGSSYRITPVECWSAHPLHGCWAITGSVT
jgi:hypothetical protein